MDGEEELGGEAEVGEGGGEGFVGGFAALREGVHVCGDF